MRYSHVFNLVIIKISNKNISSAEPSAWNIIPAEPELFEICAVDLAQCKCVSLKTIRNFSKKKWSYNSWSGFEHNSWIVNVESFDIIDKLNDDFLGVKSVIRSDICSCFVAVCVSRERQERSCPFLTGVAAQLNRLCSEAIVVSDKVDDEVFFD